MENVTSSVETLLGLGTTVLDFIMGNAMLSTLFCGSLVGVACYVISKVKRTAKR